MVKDMTLYKRIVLFEKTNKNLSTSYMVIRDYSSLHIIHGGNTSITFEPKTAKLKPILN
jgi:hypothetical protein